MIPLESSTKIATATFGMVDSISPCVIVAPRASFSCGSALLIATALVSISETERTALLVMRRSDVKGMDSPVVFRVNILTLFVLLAVLPAVSLVMLRQNAA
jgi:hypothetical protein